VGAEGDLVPGPGPAPLEDRRCHVAGGRVDHEAVDPLPGDGEGGPEVPDDDALDSVVVLEYVHPSGRHHGVVGRQLDVPGLAVQLGRGQQVSQAGAEGDRPDQGHDAERDAGDAGTDRDRAVPPAGLQGHAHAGGDRQRYSPPGEQAPGDRRAGRDRGRPHTWEGRESRGPPSRPRREEHDEQDQADRTEADQRHVGVDARIGLGGPGQAGRKERRCRHRHHPSDNGRGEPDRGGPSQTEGETLGAVHAKGGEHGLVVRLEQRQPRQQLCGDEGARQRREQGQQP
jgi:hypothetical protein